MQGVSADALGPHWTGRMKRWTTKGGAFLTAAFSLACHSTQPPPLPYDFTRAADIVRAMHDRYFGDWPSSLVYVQHALPPSSRGDMPEFLLVAVKPPGQLRVDFEPREQKNGLLVVRDTQYVIAAGRPVQVARMIQPLLLLQHDVYYRTASETLDRLRELRVDLTRAREDTWQERPAFVIGAAAGDTRSPQLWVDRRMMLLVRWIQPSPLDASVSLDTQLSEYERLGASWVPRRLEVYEASTQTARWEFRQIRANIVLDSMLFQPDNWSRARHWYQTPVLRD